MRAAGERARFASMRRMCRRKQTDVGFAPHADVVRYAKERAA
jgi:hypothetical protein